ncbi:MAG: Rrf2 family transcriptional regulator [Candidatus Omnitrophica bacterium]|nr:Rrf2 family transcriptional regulator [Candidatus Omnitrophota bacterium]
MFRLYSKGCEYVIRALALVNASKEGRCFSVKDICRKARLPEWYTRKVFQSLVRNGYLEASRGPGGGYTLKVHPSKISLLNMIRAVDGKDVLDQCMMSSGKCKNKKSCVMHNKWIRIKESVVRELKSVTVQDLMDLTSGRSKHVSTLKRRHESNGH